MRILELGSYVAPAYAGMLLAEQGHDVVKWCNPDKRDPIKRLRQGQELWDWINYRKTLVTNHSRDVALLARGDYNIIIDNHRAVTWKRWGIDDLDTLAKSLDVVWVSLRADDDKRSFDVIAQARAWGDLGMLPFYIGDTAAGLWLAFKALAAQHPGHHVIRQAASLAKLVEGELVVNRAEWDSPGTYFFDDAAKTAVVDFRGEMLIEPVRDADWRRDNLAHDNGRYII
jgi:hypothetical protein